MNNDHLEHYGVLGMKWGVRRYQNADGTLTAEGRRRARKEVRADNKEAFDMEFLEIAPQEKNGHAITDAELIKEYSKYLDDPDKYNR